MVASPNRLARRVPGLTGRTWTAPEPPQPRLGGRGPPSGLGWREGEAVMAQRRRVFETLRFFGCKAVRRVGRRDVPDLRSHCTKIQKVGCMMCDHSSYYPTHRSEQLRAPVGRCGFAPKGCSCHLHGPWDGMIHTTQLHVTPGVFVLSKG